MLWAIMFATPFFIFWGWLSDKIGRKWIMMAGLLLGILTYRPIFDTFLKDTNYVELKETSAPIGDVKIKKETIKNTNDSLIIYSQHYSFSDNRKYTLVNTDTLFAKKDKAIGYGKAAFLNKHLSSSTYRKFVSLVFLLILYVTMAYGPVAAFLVELFPTKIRYTSMSLPYHIGNGVFGGLVPFIGLLLTTTYNADPLVGLWYPIGVAALCFVIGTMYLTNKIDRNIKD